MKWIVRVFRFLFPVQRRYRVTAVVIVGNQVPEKITRKVYACSEKEARHIAELEIRYNIDIEIQKVNTIE